MSIAHRASVAPNSLSSVQELSSERFRLQDIEKKGEANLCMRGEPLLENLIAASARIGACSCTTYYGVGIARRMQQHTHPWRGPSVVGGRSLAHLVLSHQMF